MSATMAVIDVNDHSQSSALMFNLIQKLLEAVNRVQKGMVVTGTDFVSSQLPGRTPRRFR